MARKERQYHKNFIDYQKFIVSHPNYAGLPDSIGSDGQIKWVTAGKSDLGRRRKEWWIKKGKELASKGIIIPSHAQLSPIVLANHPTKKKACQTCGTVMSLEYVYPTKAKRIAFEQLAEYKLKENRRTKDLENIDLQKFSTQISAVINRADLLAAKQELLKIIDSIAIKAEKEFKSGKELRQSLLDD